MSDCETVSDGTDDPLVRPLAVHVVIVTLLQLYTSYNRRITVLNALTKARIAK